MASLLVSSITGEPFDLRTPSDSRLLKLRNWKRVTDNGKNVNFSEHGSRDNNWRWHNQKQMNREYLRVHNHSPVGLEDFKSIDWQAPAELQDEPMSPKTVPANNSKVPGGGDDVDADTASNSGMTKCENALCAHSDRHDSHQNSRVRDSNAPNESFSKYIKYIDDEATKKAQFSPESSLASTECYSTFINYVNDEATKKAQFEADMASSSSYSADMDEDVPTIEAARLAMPFRIPPRGSSWRNLKVFEKRDGVANKGGKTSPVSATGAENIHIHIGLANFVTLTRPGPPNVIDVKEAFSDFNDCDFPLDDEVPEDMLRAQILPPQPQNVKTDDDDDDEIPDNMIQGQILPRRT